MPLKFLVPCAFVLAMTGCNTNPFGLAVESDAGQPDTSTISASADAGPTMVDAAADGTGTFDLALLPDAPAPADLAPDAPMATPDVAPDLAPDLAPDVGIPLCTAPVGGSPCSGPLPRSCNHLYETDVRASGAYRLDPDGDGAILPFVTYCEMQAGVGGWTLLAKVHTADLNDVSEPRNWFSLETNSTALANLAFERNRPPASHGAYKFVPLLGAGSVTRFELHAQLDQNQTARWYKAVGSASSFVSWFGSDSTPSRVCTDLAMTANCSSDTIHENRPGLAATVLGGMNLSHYGFVGEHDLHMRLDTDTQTWASGVCSSTFDHQGNAWKDLYSFHWGNGLLIWLK